MLPSICLYTLVLVAVIFGSIVADKKNDKRILWAVIVLLTLFAGLRGHLVGIDTQTYIEKIGLIANGSGDTAYGLEKTFKIICYLLTRISKSPNFVITVFALLTNGCVLCRFWDLRKISSLGCMVACYYMAYFFMSMNVMRQFCAVAIIFYGTRYLERKKQMLYGICVVAAMLFHRSAVVGFVLVPFEVLFWGELSEKKRKFYRNCLYLMPLILIAGFLALRKYLKYFTLDTVDVGLMVFAKLLFFAATFLYVFGIFGEHCFEPKRRIRMLKSRFGVLLIIVGYFLGICTSFLGYISDSAGRIAWYFLLFEGAYLGMLLRIRDKKTRLFFRVCIIVMMGYIFLRSMLNNSQGTMPYMFMWQ